MSKNAVTLGNMLKQPGPHCHGAIHGGPVPVPIPHPGLPLTIAEGKPMVKIGGKPAATVLCKSAPCMLPSCIPGGPGMISKGSGTVKVMGFPAARVGDMSAHTSCVAPIPAPTGKIMPPGAPTVKIGD